MQFDFLEAADGLSLTKRFRYTSGEIETEPYPFVKYVNSHREEATNVQQLGQLIEKHAHARHCLLKGLLNEPCINASRAGRTDADAATRWVLLDLDFQEGWSSIDAFLAELNPDWADVSYVFQHSASAGIKYPHGLRGHLWIMLDEPMPPALLKQWLKERNLALTQLKSRIELAANGMALRWPLDITTCQNDKLIYIAPPEVEGMHDPLEGERFVVCSKAKDFAPIPRTELFAATLEHRTQETIDALRKDAGLSKRSPKYKESGTLEILTNPEKGTVTGVKRARGFVYLNLNGGDSWGYYFPANKPTLLYNFKGEPTVRLRDIAPEFYQNYIQQLQQEYYGNHRPYVFREPLRDTYYNVIYSPDEDAIKMLRQASSKEKLSDFMQQFAQTMPEPIEDWTVEFDPTTTEVINPGTNWVNLFRPSGLIRYAENTQRHIDEIPPVINKLINSICGDDGEAKWHFINWLACIFQNRHRTETSWIFHGVPGTGKGMLLSRVLRSLLGSDHVTQWTMQNFEEQYNAALEQTCLLWLDEFKVHDARSSEMVMNKLKTYITEHEIPVRAMRSNTVQVPNYLNVVIAVNHPDPVHLHEQDRRFNVAPPQEQQLKITEEEVDEIDNELVLFATYLWRYNADQAQARRVLYNEARQQMVVASQTSGERFFAALREGDLNWFMGYLREDMPLNDTLYYHNFQRAVQDWVRQALHNDGPVKISRDDLTAAYNYIIGHGMTPAKFTRMCNIHRLTIQTIRVGGRTMQGASLDLDGDRDRMNEVLGGMNENNLQSVQ